MEAFQEELLTVLAAKEPELTDMIVDQPALPIPGAASYSRDELRQMVKGFWSLIREAITGESRELRDMYFSTVFPALRDSGTTAVMVVTGSARTLFHVEHALTSGVSEANRPRARDWLIEYFCAYIGDMAQIWASAG